MISIITTVFIVTDRRELKLYKIQDSDKERSISSSFSPQPYLPTSPLNTSFSAILQTIRRRIKLVANLQGRIYLKKLSLNNSNDLRRLIVYIVEMFYGRKPKSFGISYLTT